jgi:hypothetical protein
VQRRGAEGIAFAQPHGAGAGLAKLRGIRQHGREHGFQLAGRTADDLEDLGGRGLLLQRIAQIVSAFPKLLE